MTWDSMVWGRTSDRDEQRARGDALTAAYHGPAGMPAPREGQIPGHWKSAPTGSRGGAPIWVMAEAWVPGFNCSCAATPRAECPAHAGADRLKASLRGTSLARLARTTTEKNDHVGVEREADPDGFAVFGRYPKGWLEHVISTQLLGAIGRDDILHVCSGTLGPEEKWTVDLRAEARPLVQASGTALPFRDASFRAVMLDPPYSDEYARNLYRTGMPRNSWLLREAARVVTPIGRIGILHVAVPFSPPGCRLVKVYGVSTGVGFRIRAFTIYEREQDGLFAAAPSRSARRAAPAP